MIASGGRELGEKRAERGIKRAAFSDELQIRRDTLRFLDSLLASPTGCATTADTVNDLAGKFGDGGKWRSSVPKRLKAEGLIASESVAKSCRVARHAGYLTEWRLIDRSAAERYRSELWVTLQKVAGESTAIDSPALNLAVNSQSTGKKDHGPTD